MKRIRTSALIASLLTAAALSGCASLGLGVSLPLGRAAGVGVSIDSGGQIGVGVGVGRGGVQVGVGGTTRLPARPEAAASAVIRGAPQWE